MHRDVVILGGGLAGYDCALRSAVNGLLGSFLRKQALRCVLVNPTS